MVQKRINDRINAVNDLINNFGKMTLRQVYYQLAPSGLKYNQVCYAIHKGRENGLIDMDAIVDRSRPSYGLDTWNNPSEILNYIKNRYKLDYWSDQPHRVEIWTEKDALSAIIYEEAGQYRVPVRVTRGFLSISNKHAWSDENKVILYFGDFDPSGLCMDFGLKNDIFLDYGELHRIALTPEQIEQHSLPSVPVKMDDPRAKDYVKLYGSRGWELDSLNPIELRTLVRDSITKHMKFNLDQKRSIEADHRQDLHLLASTYKENRG